MENMFGLKEWGGILTGIRVAWEEGG
jgi:hypothetical protein